MWKFGNLRAWDLGEAGIEFESLGASWFGTLGSGRSGEGMGWPALGWGPAIPLLTLGVVLA